VRAAQAEEVDLVRFGAGQIGFGSLEVALPNGYLFGRRPQGIRFGGDPGHME